MRQPSNKEWNQVTYDLAFKRHLSPSQARALRDTLGYGFENGQYEKDLLIITHLEFIKQFEGFHEQVKKYANCSHITVLHDDKCAFIVYPD